MFFFSRRKPFIIYFIMMISHFCSLLQRHGLPPQEQLPMPWQNFEELVAVHHLQLAAFQAGEF
jgi:hypothetical protein